MYRTQLISQLETRHRWACNDCRTFLYAKSQLGWQDHEQWLGGGNMAKALILFAFWDVMAGIYAHSQGPDQRLIWTAEDEQAVYGLVESFTESKNEPQDRPTDVMSSEQKKRLKWQWNLLRLVPLKIGEVVDAGGALSLFLNAFQEHSNLGVKPQVFAHEIRPKFRNKLAHMYAPELNKGTGSLRPQPMYFNNLMHLIANHPEPIVSDDKSIVNGVAMLRDSDRLAAVLTAFISDSFTENQSQRALAWLGLLDQIISESSKTQD